MKKIALQTEGGDSTGWGHVIRCAHLVLWLDDLSNTSTSITFFIRGNDEVCNYLNNQLIDSVNLVQLSTTGAVSQHLESGFDYCYLDLFDVSERTLKEWNEYSEHVVLFDELKKHPSLADVIIQAQLTTNDTRIKQDAGSLVLRGLDYFVVPIMPSEITKLSTRKPIADEPPHKLFIMLGGSSYKQSTMLVASAIAMVKQTRNIDSLFILGYEADRPTREQILELLPTATVKFGVSQPMSYMHDSHIGVLSGGYSKYEAAFCGLPTILLSVHDHQKRISKVFARTGAGRYLGSTKTITAERLAKNINQLLASPSKRRSMRECGQRLIDGKGAKRIIEQVDEDIPVSDRTNPDQ